MRIFLTGGTGFIGSHVVKTLVKNNHEVTVLARNPDKVPGLIGMKGVSFLEGSLDSRAEIVACLKKGFDAAIHNANASGETGYEYLMNDTAASVFLMEAAQAAGVRHFLYTSSTACNDYVYMTQHVHEAGPEYNVYSDTKANVVTFYGATKAATEIFLTAASHTYGMRLNIIRPGYVFGNPAVEGAPIEADTRFLDILRAAKNNETIKLVKNDGTQFIEAGDIAHVYLKAVESDFNHRTWLALANRFVTWESIAQLAIEMTGSTSSLSLEDKKWRSDGPLFDVSDIERDFGLSFDPREKLKTHLEYLLTQL